MVRVLSELKSQCYPFYFLNILICKFRLHLLCYSGNNLFLCRFWNERKMN